VQRRVEPDLGAHHEHILGVRPGSRACQLGRAAQEVAKKPRVGEVERALRGLRIRRVHLSVEAKRKLGNGALRRKLVGRNLVDVDKSVILESVTGEKIYGDYMMVRDLSIGGIGLTNLAVVFTDAHTFKQLGLDKKPALLLGMNAIRAFKKVSIDFANRKFRVVLPEHSALDTEVASVGIPD